MSPSRPYARRAEPVAPGIAGFTLIELLVVLLLIGILTGIAVPSYRSHVLRANRAEGRAALLALAVAQEKFYLECHRYAAELAPALDADCEAQRLAFPERSERGYYRLAIASADQVSWSATATPAGPPQDADSRCRQLRLDGSGHRSARDAGDSENSQECWSR